MTIYSIIFYVLACVTLLSTALAITRQNPVHAVAFMVLSFFATALLFFLLGAPLLAALEVIIYAGAIMVLFLFIIMTVNLKKKETEKTVNFRRWTVPLFLSGIALIAAIGLIVYNPGTRSVLKTAMASPAAFGRFLFEKYWLPVEIVSFLLFVSLVGALFLGRKPDKSAAFSASKSEQNNLTGQKSQTSEDKP